MHTERFKGGQVFLGYESIGRGMLAINHAEVELVNLVLDFRKRLNMTYDDIAHFINEHKQFLRSGTKLRGRSEYKFRGMTLKRIVENEGLYRGEFAFAPRLYYGHYAPGLMRLVDVKTVKESLLTEEEINDRVLISERNYREYFKAPGDEIDDTPVGYFPLCEGFDKAVAFYELPPSLASTIRKASDKTFMTLQQARDFMVTEMGEEWFKQNAAMDLLDDAGFLYGDTRIIERMYSVQRFKSLRLKTLFE